MLGFEPDAQGEHDFLYIEKRNSNTQWVARQLAAIAGVQARDVGYAGMKDRHAVTRQWFSVRRPAGDRVDWNAQDIAGVTVKELTRNSRKLRRGAHKGNRFTIKIKELDKISEVLYDSLVHMREHGVPNYFGEQRFGHGYRNLGLALALFGGKRLPREKRSIALSAARSWLFNQFLQQRIEDGGWQTVVAGQIVQLEGSGSVFEATADVDIQRRCEQLDIHPVLPLWGRSGGSRYLPDAAVSALLQQHDALAEGLQQHVDMGLRASRMVVHDLQWVVADDELTLSFYLGRGGFATALLREIIHY